MEQGSARNYTDILPIDQLTAEVTNAEGRHLVRGPHGGERHVARYRLTVKADTATLDYRAFQEHNQKHKMILGQLGLRFTDGRRNEVRSVLGNNEPQRLGKDVDVRIVELTPNRMPTDSVHQLQGKEAMVLLRPDQAEFRRRLNFAYEYRCCISGCNIAYALEAAHIDSFRDRQSNDLRNGLLLRRDLHSLFDAGHLAIEPESRKVYFSAEASEYKEYRNAHSNWTLAAPQQSSQSPNPAALKRRWTRFTEQHGDLTRRT